MAEMFMDYSNELMFRAYTADCLGVMVRGENSGFKLYSELIGKAEKPQSAQQILDHVKYLFQ